MKTMDRKNMKYTACMLSVLFLCAGVWAQDAAMDLDAAFKAIRTWEAGGDAAAMNRIIDEVMAAWNQPEMRTALADRLAELMLAGDTTFDAKRFACRNLQVIGAEKQLAALAPLLTDPDRAHLVRYAFQATPGDAVDAAFRDALENTSGQLRIGLLNSLAERGNAGSVEALSKYVSDSDVGVAAAAVEGLGRIGSPDALGMLRNKAADIAPAVQPRVIDSMLRCADNLVDAGELNAAEAVYEPICSDLEKPVHVRLAALRGLTETRGAKAVDLVLEALTSGDPVWQSAALMYARTLPGGAAVAEAFAGKLADLHPEYQALLLEALAARGDAAVLPAVEKCLQSQVETVRNAALNTLGILGNGETALLLARHAAGGDGSECDTARKALYAMSSADADAALKKALQEEPDNVRAEMIRALAERRVRDAGPTIFAATKSENPSVREEAWRALGLIASRSDLPELLRMLSDAGGNDLDKAENALIMAMRRIEPAQKPAEPVIAAFSEATAGDKKAALIRILAESRVEEALVVIRGATDAEDAAVADAAVTALANWPDAAVMPELLAIAKSDASAIRREIALEGYVHLCRNGGLAPSEQVRKLADVLSWSDDRGAKRNALAGLSDTGDKTALEVVEKYLDDPDVGKEAAVAAEKIRKNFYVSTASSNADKAKNAHDSDINTRWDTGTFQTPDQWFQLDMTGETRLRGIVLDTTPSSNDYPRGFRIYVFNDENNMGDPVAEGSTDRPSYMIRFDKPVSGRYIRIVQTGKSDSYYWSIHELRILPD